MQAPYPPVQSMTRWLAFALVLLWFSAFASPPAAAAPPDTPDTPAGRMLRAWLDTFNSGDRAMVEAFRRERGIEESVEESLAYRDYSGGLALHSVGRSEANEVAATLRERDAAQADVNVVLTLDPTQPQRIARLSIEPQPIPRQTETEALAGLRKYAHGLVASERFSGVYLVARHDRILQHTALGLAERNADSDVGLDGSHGIAMTLDTRLRIASLNKNFTAVAVLQLVEAGKLSLDDTVGDYLAEFPNREVATKVRIRHLLTHTGGVGEIGFWDSPEFAAPASFIAYRDRMRTHADYVAQHARQPLAFEPGTQMAYSNYGYVLLGRIIERVSGLDYHDYLRRHVFAPAGMRATGLEPESKRIRRIAKGYTLRDGHLIDTRDLLPWRGTAAGGAYTTAADLLKFARALQSGTLLPPARLAEATRTQSTVGWYGFGFIVVGEGGLRRYGHAGDFPGMNADFRVYPESGYVLIALSNLDPPSAYRLFRYFEPRMPLD
jgi:D-alanyl-D-alanine carboxypeptidase